MKGGDYAMTATRIEKWRHFIEQVTGGNKKLMKQLQEAAGYMLFSDNSPQEMLALFAGAN